MQILQVFETKKIALNVDLEPFPRMRVAGLEPARMLSPRDFKSLASTYSATPADL